MADPDTTSRQDHHSDVRPFRFGTRHLLYITMAVCVCLGIPGLVFVAVYVAFWVVGPWALLGPLILIQLLFVLAVPPLRHQLLKRREQ